ncbi:MAG: hypothetical protein ACTSXU_15795 [Promethearchaeota archaeon]
MVYESICSKKNFDDPKVPINIFKISKPISIIPTSHGLYDTFEEEIDDGSEPSDATLKKREYLDHFYSDSDFFNEFDFTYRINENTFQRYSEFYNTALESINSNSAPTSTPLISLIDIDENQQLITLDYKIAPYLFLLESDVANVETINDFFAHYRTEIQAFNTILLYSTVSYLTNNLTDDVFEYLKDFDKVILWLPDFNEIYARKDDIQQLCELLRKIKVHNDKISYLFGGLMIGHFFQDLVDEVIIRSDIYPGKKKIPTEIPYGRRTKRIFFPEYGRVTKLENLLTPPYIHHFNCNCISCREFHEGSTFPFVKRQEALQKLNDSPPKKFYHNIHSFLQKLNNILCGEEIEKYPEQELDKQRLFLKWKSALE